MIKIGRISYLNTEPFFYKWPSHPDSELFPGYPRVLAQAAQNGLIDCSPLPLVECWRLEKEFEPLGDWGVSVNQAAGSVLLFSKSEIHGLDGGCVGVTHETSTSSVLLDLLLRVHYGLSVTLRRGFLEEDQGRLLIGDSALLSRQEGLMGYPFVYDLGREWIQWQKCPFVFARWVVRKSLTSEQKAMLKNRVESALKEGLRLKSEISSIWAPRVSLSPSMLNDYLDGFSYQLGEREIEGMNLFRDLTEEEAVR